MRTTGFCLAFLLLTACGGGSDTGAPAAAQATNDARWQYPRERTVDGHKVIVHAPQIRSWDKFERFTAQVAVEFADEKAGAKYGVIEVSGATAVDLEERVVRIAKPKVDRVTFTGEPGADQEAGVRRGVESEPLEVPLDVFLFHLAGDVLESPPPAGFNAEAPPIYVVEVPAFLLFINGEAVTAPLADTGLEVVVNANFPTLRDPATGTYYLLSGKSHYWTTKLGGSWTAIEELPAAFAKIPAKGEHAAIAAAAATKPDGAAPQVITTFRPAEIVVLDGKPAGEEIPGTGGLETITNTESPLFRLNKRYYLLVSGRWFSTANLSGGSWKFTMPLPEAFALIPADNAAAGVRASVPGTLEARRAALEAQLPTQKIVKSGAAPDVKVSYAGDPQFEAIPDTDVSRAVNAGHDIIESGGRYYLCYQGAWYVASAPTGPWLATAEVPMAIYDIPPSSPAYPVTQVTATTTTTGSIVYSYPPSYSSNVYVVYGVPYYGTGWYYPPYIYGAYYYPYYTSYGHGSWYNPNTGRYGSRSVWYGPYGGYSYSEGYNPNTGRYGYIETAWDGDEWASYGEVYNPRTGVSAETSRYYNEDTNKSEMNRTIEGPRGNEMDVERKTDFDEGTSTVKRETSRGGSSEITHERNADGSISSSGTIEGAGGRTAEISGEHNRGDGTTTIKGSEGGSGTIEREAGAEGVRRQGDFTTAGGETISSETIRKGDKTITGAESSGGGRAISASEGLGRTTIAESGSGDLYAGHNGEVYKKTDDGWQKYEQGSGWQPTDAQGRTGEAAAATNAAATTGERRGPFDAPATAQANTRTQDVSAGTQQRQVNPNFSQLDRDAAARRGGTQNFDSRRAAQSRSGGMQRQARPRRR